MPTRAASMNTREMGHTPGEWEISHEPPRWIIQAEHGPGKKAIAYMVGDYIQCAANAKLISAAPSLFKKASDLLSLLDSEVDKDGVVTIRMNADQVRELRAAIAKASP